MASTNHGERLSVSDTLTFLHLTFWCITVTIWTNSLNIQWFCILPTECRYVFPVIFRINSNFPKYH
jgi:hypothetical protein